MLEDTKSLEQPANIIDEEDEDILPLHMKSKTEQKFKCGLNRKQTDAELRWRQSRVPVNSLIFSGLPIINIRSSPFQFFCLFFNEEILKIIYDETNRYGKQQTHKTN
jgi:hypothetical protein